MITIRRDPDQEAGFEDAVKVTLGLPFIGVARSCTAFDIAGTGQGESVADAALRLAPHGGPDNSRHERHR